MVPTGKMTSFGWRTKRNWLGQLLTLLLISCCSIGDLPPVNGAGAACGTKSALVGLSSDLVMVQHQLRGSVVFLDDCTFKVTRFDMIAGIDVYWWGSNGADFYNMTHGFPISGDKLEQTYKNKTFEVKLHSNYTWDNFKVLSVWDISTSSDFGHILLDVELQETEEIAPPPAEGGHDRGSPVPAPAPAPGPAASWISSASPPSPASAPAPSVRESEIVGYMQPTMFENCAQLSKTYRLRWTVNWASQTVDLGLEGALTTSQYMAFGWARPEATANFMLRSDVVIAGFDEKGEVYAEDYYLGDYEECNWDATSPSGVCPDSLYAGGDVGANNVNVLHGQQIDGITLIRYQRLLRSTDPKYDVSINSTRDMQVVWAMGMMKPPDIAKGNHTPQNHGPNYAYRKLNLRDSLDECLGPMIARNVHTSEVVVADRGTTLVVASDSAVNYPDPPFPNKVFFINQKEAPLLKVERGVPVTFSIQAGHDVAFYITDNPVGGASNASETIYAGGPDYHGVPVIPYPLVWHPNRTTPDLVYYQDYFMKKRGWKVQVVDGGLSDMYNASATLADSKVTIFWTVSNSRIYMAVRGEVKSGYLAVAFGSGMVNSFSYVGWVDETGVSHISPYWMDGKKASRIHATGEELTDMKCEQVEGIVSFEFSRALQPPCSGKGILCKNVIDPGNLVKVVWAMGDAWTADTLADSNMHDDISTRPTLIHLLSGAAKVEHLQPVLAVHGFMMFIAWGLLLPGGVLGARYLKSFENNLWFEIHRYSQMSAIAVMLMGLLFAVAELRGFNTRTIHMKVGMVSILLALWQAANGYLRPKTAAPGESQRPQRVVWEYVHMYSGRSSLVFGFVSLVTGISQLARREGVENMKGYQWAMFAWFLALAALVGYIEVQGFWNKKGLDTVGFDRVLNDEDDGEEPLTESHDPYVPRGGKDMQASPARGMEIQLEPMN